MCPPLALPLRVPEHRKTWVAAAIGLAGLTLLVLGVDNTIAAALTAIRDVGAQAFTAQWWLESLIELLFIAVGAALFWSAGTLAWLLVMRPSRSAVQTAAGVLASCTYFYGCYLADTYLFTAEDSPPAGHSSWAGGAAWVCAGPVLVFGTIALARLIGGVEEDWRRASTIRGMFLWIGWTAFFFLPTPGSDWGADLIPGWSEGQAHIYGFAMWILFLVVFTKLGWRISLRLLGIERPPDFPDTRRRGFRIA